MPFPFPFRQIHLDFHTSPDIPDVGADFDAEAFAGRLAAARVNSVTLFAKCHHGHLYYNTPHPARHPALPAACDLLREQITALHRRHIRAPIYLSVMCDEFAAATHPEWRVVLPDNHLAGSPLEACWHLLDMSSPYQDYLADQLAEVLKRFRPVDGIFLDMCWDQPSISTWALAGMAKAKLNPEREEDRNRYARQVALAYMARYKGMVDAAAKKREVPVAFNVRPLGNLGEEKQFLRHIEIEALPTGGWGYLYFPLNVRYARTFGLPTLGMTGRFHKSWADFGGLKPEAALKYECCQMLAHGARCSIGDQLHPRGTLDPEAYNLIGAVYRHVEACEPWCEDAVPMTDIAVIRAPENEYMPRPGNANEGVLRALTQLRQQFDFVAPDADLRPYRLVVVPESAAVTPALAARLKTYERGGALLLCGTAGFQGGRPVCGASQGVAMAEASPFSVTYVRLDGPLAAGFPADTDHVMYERGLRLTPAAGATAWGKVVEPYFERDWRHFCSHRQTPPARTTPYTVVAGRGRMLTTAFPLFTAYAVHGNPLCRHLIGKCLDHLLPEPLLRVQAPSFVEATVTRQPGRHLVHLLGYAPVRRTQTLDIVEEASLAKNVGVSLRLDRAPATVTVQPAGTPLPCRYEHGRAEVTLPELDGHALLVFS
ncbi:MAG: alpha-amylase family protein [Lentisphaeria bacterium]